MENANIKSRIGLTKCLLFMMTLILAGVSVGYAQGPAPLSKQLNMGGVGYFSDVYYPGHETMRDWWANRIKWCIFDWDRADDWIPKKNAMKAINPNLILLHYDISFPYASESTAVITWALGSGLNPDDLLIRTNASVTVKYNAGSWTTTPAGGILTASGNLVVDPRNPLIGAYMFKTFLDNITTWEADGVMPDMECPIGGTGGLSWWDSPFFPFGPNNGEAAHWQNGFDGSKFVHSWSTNYSQTMDSCRALRMSPTGWYGVFGDSAETHGKIIAPNWAAWGGPENGNKTGWTTEVQATAIAEHGALLGELSCYFAPSGYSDGGYSANNEINCNNVAYACSTIADYGVDLFIWPIITGFKDSSIADGFTFARSRMNSLGLMLDCLNPTTPYNGKSTKYYFGTAAHADGSGPANQFLEARSLYGITRSDSCVWWDNAYGKYFGRPQKAHNEALTGTDGAGQTYRIHRIALLNPNNDDTLTYAIGRYCRGTNRSQSATAVDVTLGDTYYELHSGGTYTGPVSTTTIANAEWRFFIKDTLLANNGTSSDTIPPGTIHDIR